MNNNLVAKEGYPFIAFTFFIFFIALVFHFNFWITILFLAAFIFTVAFFRNPERPCPGAPNEVLCPADGTIVAISKVEEDRFLGEPALVISIFMSPFNVHINRAPVSATIEKAIYNPGKFLNAASEKSSLENEQNALILRIEDGRRIVVNQIAGLVARRIVCYVEIGDHLARGERFGMIRFGSRVDLHLPPETKLSCAVGERVYGGDTIMGVLSDG